MSIFEGWGSRRRALFADTKGPWGTGSGAGGGSDSGSGGGKPRSDEPSVPPSGPWGEPPKRGARPPITGPSTVSSLDDFLRKSDSLDYVILAIKRTPEINGELRKIIDNPEIKTKLGARIVRPALPHRFPRRTRCAPHRPRCRTLCRGRRRPSALRNRRRRPNAIRAATPAGAASTPSSRTRRPSPAGCWPHSRLRGPPSPSQSFLTPVQASTTPGT